MSAIYKGIKSSIRRMGRRQKEPDSGRMTIIPEDAAEIFNELDEPVQAEFNKRMTDIKNNSEEIEKQIKTSNNPINNTNKRLLKKYIENLYKYLGDSYCFVSGAFVIADPYEKLYTILKNSITLNLTSLKLTSHTKFKKQEEQIIENLNAEHSQQPNHTDKNIYENWMLDNLMYEMKCKCKHDQEGYTTRPARNVKWYQFLGVDNKLYIFLKLEDWGSIHPKHVLGAVNRYILHNSNESCTDSRREDCKHHCHRHREPLDEPSAFEDDSDTTALNPISDKKQKKKNKKEEKKMEKEESECCHPEKKHQYSAFTLDAGSEVPIDEPYGRIGDEVFIPAEINNAIVENIYNDNLTMSTEDDRIIHITTHNIETGGRRHNRTKRKGKNKKTRKIRGKRAALKKTHHSNKKSRRNKK
jgi:hypothetical protein